MAHWLFKTEPDEFSIDDLANAKNAITRWDGIRNYQARNFLRDHIKREDRVLIYHSHTRPTAIVGWALVVGDTYPDPTQFDPQSPYFDPKSAPDDPRWYCVDIQFKATLHEPVTLTDIKLNKQLEHMVLLKQGRLSIQPVRRNEFEEVLRPKQHHDEKRSSTLSP